MASLQRYRSHGRDYYRIVESYRKDGKPHLHVLAHLGKVEDVLALARSRRGQLRVRSCMAGAVCALVRLAEELEIVASIDQVLERRGRNGRRDGLSVGQSLVAAAIGRACAPTSKRAFAEWAGQTFLPERMGFQANRLTSQHFWDQMDAVPEDALGEMEERIVTRLVEVEGLDVDACVYDTTNFYTYLDSTNDRSRLAQRGHNKQKRHDLRQLGLALVVDRVTRLPLFHHLYSGRRNDARTLAELIAPIRERLRRVKTRPEQLTLIFDAGANSKRNLEELGTHYVVVLRPSDHRRWLEEVADRLEPVTLSDGETVFAYRQRRRILDQEREVVVVDSPRLGEGQKRGLHQHLERVQQALGRIGLQSRYRAATLEKRLDRILGRQYIRRLIHYQLSESPQGARVLRFWSDLDEYRRLTRRYFGLRILATDRTDWTTAEIIEAHRRQPEAEECFKQLKDPSMIATRPQFHWTDQKLRVHAFICVLAYLMIRLLWWRQQRLAGPRLGPRSLLSELKKIRLARIAELTGKPGRPRVYHQLEEMEPDLEPLARLTRALPEV
jgi:transposase